MHDTPLTGSSCNREVGTRPIRGTALVLALVSTLLLGTDVAPADDPPPPCRVKFTSLDVTRSRFEQETWVQAIVKNLGAEPLEKITIEVSVHDSTGKEVKRLPKWTRPALPARRALICSISDTRVPNFDQVKFTVSYTQGGATRTWRFHTPKPGEPPELVDGEFYDPATESAAPGTALTLIEARTEEGAPEGSARIRCWMRNGSKAPARDVGAMIETMDGEGAISSRRFVPFGGEPIAPESTAGLRITIPGMSAEAMFTARIVQIAERSSLDPGRLGTGAAVEAGEFAFLRLTDGTLVVRGSIRNGLAEAVKNVRCTVTLEGAATQEVPLTPPPVMAAGAVARCETCLQDVPEFNGYGYDIAYDPAVKGDAPAGEGSLEGPKVESLPASEAPAESGAATAGAKPKKPAKAARVRLAGAGDVEGHLTGHKKQIKFSGDVVFLVMAFEDEKGMPVKQEGTLVVKITDDKRKVVGTVTHGVRLAAWGLDASKLTSKNATPNQIAFQPHTQELWAGLVKMKDSDAFDGWTLDVTFTTVEGPVWHWPALAAPFLEDARGPDS